MLSNTRELLLGILDAVILCSFFGMAFLGIEYAIEPTDSLIHYWLK